MRRHRHLRRWRARRATPAHRDRRPAGDTTLSDDLHALGCPVTNFSYSLDLGTLSQQASNLSSDLKAGSYTTVICACDPVLPVYLTGAEASQSYQPEFVETGADEIDQDYVARLYNQGSYGSALGISTDTPTQPVPDSSGYHAYKAEDPTGTPALFVNFIYEQMEQLAIGIEMAGPDLTPSTFQQGMNDYAPHSGEFGLWDFTPGQRTAASDFREVCWNPTTTSSFTNQAGSYNGTTPSRWTPANVPSGPPGCPT